MKEKEKTKKIFKFIIIPNSIVQSQDISNGAKLLLGHIIRLSNHGYCWASNRYFTNYFEVHKTTIIRWINELIEYHYIRCRIKKNKRKIYICKKILKNIHYCQVSKKTSELKKLIRKMPEYKKWKKKVKERDKKCRLCNMTEEELEESDKHNVTELIVHHIIPITLLINEHEITNIKEAKKCKPLWNTKNGVTLCDRCHRIKHGIECWEFLLTEKEEDSKNTNSSKNTNIYISKDIYKEKSVLETDFSKENNIDNINIETKEWVNKAGQRIGIDTIDYEDEEKE